MKKVLVFLLTIFLVVVSAFSACGENNKKAPAEPNEQQEEDAGSGEIEFPPIKM